MKIKMHSLWGPHLCWASWDCSWGSCDTSAVGLVTLAVGEVGFGVRFCRMCESWVLWWCWFPLDILLRCVLCQTGDSCPKLCPWATPEGVELKVLSSMGPTFRGTVVQRTVWSVRCSELGASAGPAWGACSNLPFHPRPRESTERTEIVHAFGCGKPGSIWKTVWADIEPGFLCSTVAV